MDVNLDKTMNKLIDSLKATVDLRIITIVGRLEVKHAFEDKKTLVEVIGEQKAIVTSINLVQGDVINAFDSEYAPGKEDALCDFHEKQVELGNKIIERNLTVLTKLVKDIMDMFKKEPEGSTPTPPPVNK